MARPSRELLIRLKLNDMPAYKLAYKAGINPNTLSKLINGIEPLKPNDERIIRIAAVLGMNAVEAFDASEGTA